MYLILAAGKQLRWGTYPVKQLLPIGNTTIIERTVRMFEGDRWIVTANPAIINKVNCPIYCPLACRFTVETLLSSRGLWRDQVVVLLGDVIYSHNLKAKLLACQDNFRAWGNEWEIFSLSFSATNNRIVGAIKDTIKQAELGEQKGTLRNLFWTYTGTDKNDTTNKLFERVCQFNDYTNDVDSPDEYESFLKQHLQTMRIDDGR